MEEKKQENQFSGMTREEIILEARKQILHSAVLALAALIVIGVACYAWFVSSKNVTAEVGKVAMRAEGFELASAGSPGKYDDKLDAALPEGEFWGDGETTTWTKKNQTIRWRVDGDSNFGNDGSKKGIRPGSEGNLSFYVIPNADGPLTINCQLNAQPQLKNPNAEDAANVKATATKLLRGHILFAYEYSYTYGEKTVTQRGISKISDGPFTVMLPDAKANELQKVTLNWFWPYLLRDAVSRPDYGETIKTWTETQNLWDYFYYNNGTEVIIDQTSPRNRNRYYNNADQFIGDNVAAIVLELTADLAE